MEAPGAAIPVERIATERLLLRCWRPEDAPRFKRALDFSLDELRPWIPWASKEPSSLEVIEDRLRGYRDDFHSGGDALFAILDPEEAEVLGGAGLYRRVGPGGIEIGYWVRSDLAGRGIATEATIALTDAGFALEGIDRIEIHCDPRNGASVAIPRKLGYVHIETRPMLDPPGGDPVASTMVWVLTAEEYRRSWT